MWADNDYAMSTQDTQSDEADTEEEKEDIDQYQEHDVIVRTKNKTS